MDIKECLQLQLSEVEMLSSMFPGGCEFYLGDDNFTSEAQAFIDGDGEPVTSSLDFTINIIINNHKIELRFDIPSDYPVCKPDCYARSNELSNKQHCKLNQDLRDYIYSVDDLELCAGSTVLWLQDNAHLYFSLETGSKDDSPVTQTTTKNDDTFSRYWIYSHHIRSKVKRKNIIDLARDNHLTGFSLPGRPGIICVEGRGDNAEDFWIRVKGWNWQRLVIKRLEKEVMSGKADERSLRYFTKFEEISFLSPNQQTRYHKSGSANMDMGLFFKYLEDHNCGYVFKDYFNVDGKGDSKPGKT